MPLLKWIPRERCPIVNGYIIRILETPENKDANYSTPGDRPAPESNPTSKPQVKREPFFTPREECPRNELGYIARTLNEKHPDYDSI